MSELIDQRRRQILAGGAALGALGFLGVLPQAVEAAEQSAAMPLRRRNRLPFDAVPVSRADGITVRRPATAPARLRALGHADQRALPGLPRGRQQQRPGPGRAGRHAP